MANALPKDKPIAIISALAEGSSIRSIERMTGIKCFGADVDYGQIVKVYVHNGAQHPERKYSAPHFASDIRRPITGNPEMELVSTSHVERLNATTRLHVKLLSRLTLAFSKKLDNFKAAVALHFAYYNFVRRRAALRCTPKGHETAHRVYTWAHDTDDPEHPRRHVTVLHLHPIKSAQDAVRAAIIQEFKERNAEA